MISRLNKKTEPSNYTYFAKNLNSDGVKSIIINLDACIVSRFHAMIFALTLLKPMVILGWSHKYRTLFQEFGCAEYLVSPTDPPEQVGAKLDALTDEPYRLAQVERLRATALVRKRITTDMWAETQSILSR